jgi:hypothetical protein
MGFRALFFWSVSLFMAHLAHATDLERQAEHRRLGVEMDHLAQRHAWNGVEQSYRKLLELDIEPNHTERVLSAEAARQLGDLELCYSRLRAAAAVRPTVEIVDWLWQIDNTYGHVELTIPRGRDAVLVNKTPIEEAGAKKALEAAVDQLKRNGSFTGLLPAGSYTFVGQSFTVEPGISRQLNISKRQWKQSRSAKQTRVVPLETERIDDDLDLVVFGDIDPLLYPEEEPSRVEEQSPSYIAGSVRVRDQDGMEPWSLSPEEPSARAVYLSPAEANVELFRPDVVSDQKRIRASLSLGVLSAVGLASGGYAVWQYTVIADAHQRYLNVDSDDMAGEIWREEVEPARIRMYTASSLGGAALLSGSIVWIRATSDSRIGMGIAPRGLMLQGRW